MQILVVEDDNRISNFLVKGLAECGYLVTLCKNAEDVLKRCIYLSVLSLFKSYSLPTHYEDYRPNSGARPGARREVVESYIKRLKELEELALSYPRSEERRVGKEWISRCVAAL